MSDIDDLIARVAEAERPTHELDVAIVRAVGYSISTVDPLRAEKNIGDTLRIVDFVNDPITSSLSAITGLIEVELPGWAWKVGTCSVSDDAWIVPDFNDPVHGERLKREIGPFKIGSIWDYGIDIDRRPSGQPALALCLAFLKAYKAMKEAGK